jgi:hypothetical protein
MEWLWIGKTSIDQTLLKFEKNSGHGLSSSAKPRADGVRELFSAPVKCRASTAAGDLTGNKGNRLL